MHKSCEEVAYKGTSRLESNWDQGCEGRREAVDAGMVEMVLLGMGPMVWEWRWKGDASPSLPPLFSCRPAGNHFVRQVGPDAKRRVSAAKRFRSFGPDPQAGCCQSRKVRGRRQGRLRHRAGRENRLSHGLSSGGRQPAVAPG